MVLQFPTNVSSVTFAGSGVIAAPAGLVVGVSELEGTQVAASYNAPRVFSSNVATGAVQLLLPVAITNITINSVAYPVTLGVSAAIPAADATAFLAQGKAAGGSSRLVNGGNVSSVIQPSSINIPYATFLPGIAGSYDAITQAAGNKRVYILGGSQAAWSGIITGTDATISGSSDFGEDSTTFYASIDGAAAVGLTKIGTNLFQLFSGLAQGPHSVVIVAGGAYGNVVYVLSTSTAVLAVTGAPPSVYVPTWVNPFDGSALDAWSAFPINAPSVNWTPYASPGNTATASSAVPSLRVRTAATFLLITTRARYIFVGIGSSITRYDTGAAEGYARQYKVSGLSGSATTYNVWISAQPLGGGNQLLTVASDAAMVDIGSKRRLDQFGDSITFGAGCTGTGDVDTMRTASALAMTGSTYGISGTTVSALATNLPGFLSGRVIDSTNDVAVIAIGRNDASISGAAMTAQQVTDYTSCCNQLKAKYGKVICRGMLPESTYNWSGWASSINSIITSIGNANIKAAVTTGWTGIATADGTHPTDAGYITVAAYATTTYTPLI